MSRARDLADAGGIINYLDNIESDVQLALDSSVSTYKVTDTFTAPVYFKGVDIIPNNQTVAGVWEWFGAAEVWVSEIDTIASNEEYMIATESKSNHVFFETGYIGDAAAVTVTNTMQGLGDTPLSSAAAADAAVALRKTDFSATDTGGEGSFSYNNSTGAYTYTGPSLGKLIFLGGM